MNGQLGWWSKGANRRSLGCGAERGIRKAENFTCDLRQVGPESILLPDPSTPPSNAAVESSTETLQALDESSPQQTQIGGLVLSPKASEPLYLEQIARIDLRNATSICVQIVVPNEDVIVLIDMVLAFS